MKITCQACQSKYTIADDKIQGKVAKIRCRKCGATFRISGAGWIIAAAVTTLQVTWFLLAIRRVISPVFGLVLVSLTCLLALWLLPYFVPVNRS